MLHTKQPYRYPERPQLKGLVEWRMEFLRCRARFIASDAAAEHGVKITGEGLWSKAPTYDDYPNAYGYIFIHWSSSLTEEQKDAVCDKVKRADMDFYFTPEASDEFVLFVIAEKVRKMRAAGAFG